MSVRHALLAILSEGPAYGLQLHERFERRTGQLWSLNVGQVYATLQRLERDGLIADTDSTQDGAQRPYRITDEGRRELDRWIASPPELSVPPRDELIMKVMIAVHMPDADIGEFLQAHRKALVELMQRWTRLRAASETDDLPYTLMVDAELLRLESVIHWLDIVLAKTRRRHHELSSDQSDLAPIERTVAP
jgi:DNA-binding PadR family transcriptional regulator